MLPSLVLNLPELPRFILTADADQAANGCCTGIQKARECPRKEVRAGWSSREVIPPSVAPRRSRAQRPFCKGNYLTVAPKVSGNMVTAAFVYSPASSESCECPAGRRRLFVLVQLAKRWQSSAKKPFERHVKTSVIPPRLFCDTLGDGGRGSRLSQRATVRLC